MKRRKWRAALTALLLLAAVGGLLWCFFPRSMMEGELYCVTLWDGQARVDLTDRADREAVTERIARCRRVYGGKVGGYQLDRCPLELGFSYRGGSWYLIAGPEGAFAYDSGERLNWRILDGEQLWRDLASALPSSSEPGGRLRIFLIPHPEIRSSRCHDHP